MSIRKFNRTKSLSLNDEFPLRPPPCATTQRTNRPSLTKKIEDTAKIMKYIDDNIIGKGIAFLGPYGRRKVVYADYSTSGRSLQFLEDYINKEVLPAFGDLECSSAVTGLQSQLYFNEAKEIIKSAVNASADDEIIFCDGQFKNPAEYLIYLLNNSQQNVDNRSTILFVSMCEPNCNLRPWIDAGIQVEKILKTHDGFLDLVDLEKKLLKFSEHGRTLIGSFSAASRLSGIFSDDVATTILLHQYGALAIWDYNMSAQNALININPALPGATKDAIFFNANRFIGGVQAPGILVIKKTLIPNANKSLMDSSNSIGAVRAGLVVQLKESIGLSAVLMKQEKICKQILSHIRTIPEIVLLGPPSTTIKRVPTICFLVRHSRGAFLHHHFVVAVLNDVFGIQATVGTMMGQHMGIPGKLAVEYEQILDDDTYNMESLRPGYTRITFPFFMSESEIGFIMEALKMVATEAWKLLPQYVVDDGSGDWRHQSNSLAKERKVLGAIRYTDGRMLFSDRRISGPGSFPQNHADCLHTARNLFNRARKMAQKSASSENLPLQLKNERFETLRWFMLPGEAHKLLLGHSQNVKQTVPFDPNKIDIPLSLLTIHRHNSLSALEVKRYKSRSVPSSPFDTKDKMSPTRLRTDTPIIRFSLGGEVTSMMSPPTNAVKNLIMNERPARNRCYSVGSTTPEIPESDSITTTTTTTTTIPTTDSTTANNMNNNNNNFTKISNGILANERSCSCSSQTDINSFDSDTLNENQQNSLNFNLQMTGSGSCSSDCAEDISKYVQEVTKEMVTEIKSEIREVISKVEDVLENTDVLDTSTLNLTSYNNVSTDDSVSATDVAEYLKECSKDISSDIKSEIRGMVNAVDEFISPDCQTNGQKNLEIMLKDTKFPLETKNVVKQRHSDITDNRPNFTTDPIACTKTRSESYPRPNSTPSGWHSNTASCPENSTPSCPYTGAISKLIESNCVTTSQDSGINMCFQDIEEVRSKYRENINQNSNSFERNPSFSSVSSSSNRGNDDELMTTSINKVNSSQSGERNNSLAQQLLHRKSTLADVESDNESIKWHNLPKDIWKHSTEIMDEYEMLRDGDKILVCLSGSSPSFCLLHVLRQFSRARGIHIDLGAVTIGMPGIDPRVLMLYMRDLGVSFMIDQQGQNETLKSKLCSVARRKGYNVLAMGETLDKVADDFLVSVLYKGKMHAIQPHCIRDHDIRIIRPFIFVRDRQLEEFAMQKKFPTRPSSIVNRPLNASNSILKVQELINPSVYENIKNAIKPLTFKIDANKTSYCKYLMYDKLYNVNESKTRN